MKEKIKEFLKLIDLYGSTRESISDMLDDSEDITPSFKIKFLSAFNIEELEETMIPLYEKSFTESEIDQILFFLKSPIGKKMLDVNKNLSGDINEIINTWMMEKYNSVMSELANQQ